MAPVAKAELLLGREVAFRVNGDYLATVSNELEEQHQSIPLLSVS